MKKIFGLTMALIVVLLTSAFTAQAVQGPVVALEKGTTLTAASVTSTITVFPGSNKACSNATITNTDTTYNLYVTQAPNTWTANYQHWFPIPPGGSVTFAGNQTTTLYWYGKVSPTPLTVESGYYAEEPQRTNPWY